MPHLENILYDMGRLDLLARQDTGIHRLDARAKLLATAAFVVTLASFGPRDVVPLIPLILYPIALITLGNIPIAYLARKAAIVAPFVLLIGIFNPIFDRRIAIEIGGVGISSGWLSFGSISVRMLLTITTALALLAVTGFYPLCMALQRLGTPRALVVQLLLLYRYGFVLAGESLRVIRAYSLRSGSTRGVRIGVAGSMLGHLLLRTLDRARRVHEAMLCRGFDGGIRVGTRSSFGLADAAFVVGWTAFFVVVRLYNLPLIVGRLFVGSG